MWSAVADVVRPPRVVFLQGDESEVESNGESGRPPHVSAFVVATARQPARGPVLVFFTLSGVAWCCSGILAMVLYGGGFLGAMRSVFFSRAPIDAGSRWEVWTAAL